MDCLEVCGIIYRLQKFASMQVSILAYTHEILLLLLELLLFKLEQQVQLLQQLLQDLELHSVLEQMLQSCFGLPC